MHRGRRASQSGVRVWVEARHATKIVLPAFLPQYILTSLSTVCSVNNGSERASILNSRLRADFAMPRRRLEDRIHDLCQRANERDWPRILSELRRAIREHTLRVANRSAAAVVRGQPQIMRERRERRNVPEGWFLGDFHQGEDGRVN